MQTTDDPQKKKIEAVFDSASASYDGPSLTYFEKSAGLLVEDMKLEGGERLLDIATGTGHAAIIAAHRLTHGRVTGIDISEGMLDRARKKAAAQGIANVEFLRLDMEDTGFEDGRFDVACCAFGLFFLPDIGRGLGHISKMIKPGGGLFITSFGPGMMEPQKGMLLNRLRESGIDIPANLERMDSPDKVRKLLEDAGFVSVEIRTRQLGYYMKDTREWLEIVSGTAFRGLLDQLSGPDSARVLAEHTLEVEALRGGDGIWLDIEVIFASARTAG